MSKPLFDKKKMEILTACLDTHALFVSTSRVRKSYEIELIFTVHAEKKNHSDSIFFPTHTITLPNSASSFAKVADKLFHSPREWDQTIQGLIKDRSFKIVWD
jgi:hypothetical protein